VAYLIQADVVLKPHATEDKAKYRDIFRRRVERGQCFHRPYLGCREFAADFARPNGSETPYDHSDDLGRLLFDLDYARDRSGRGRPRFFAAMLDGGVLRVPPELYSREG
jgi:CRISPR-associated protein Cas5d